jgi:hypothetical protein
MRGVVPSFPNTSSWNCTFLSTITTLPLIKYLHNYANILISFPFKLILLLVKNVKRKYSALSLNINIFGTDIVKVH